MTAKRYDIFLADKIIGTTELEKADAPMGVDLDKYILSTTRLAMIFSKHSV